MPDSDKSDSENKLFTVANLLSLLRIVVTPVIIYLILTSESGSSKAAAVLFVVAALSDFFDGFLARATGTVSQIGKVLDPIADRVMIGGVIVALAVTGSAPAAGVALVILRDIFMAIGYKALERRGIKLRVSYIGKSYTALFMIAIVSLMAGIKLAGVEIGLWLFWIAVAGSIISGAGYASRGIYLLKTREAA